EQVLPGAVPTVVVTGRHLGRQEDQAEFLVGAHLSPDAVVPGVFLRALLPGVVPHLARTRNRVEDPQPLPGPHVESTHVSLVVAAADGAAPLGMCRADDDDVLGPAGGGMKPHVTGDQVTL